MSSRQEEKPTTLYTSWFRVSVPTSLEQESLIPAQKGLEHLAVRPEKVTALLRWYWKTLQLHISDILGTGEVVADLVLVALLMLRRILVLVDVEAAGD